MSVAPCRDVDEFRRAFSAIGQYLGVEPTDSVLDRFLPNMPIERMHAAREGADIAGGAGAFPFRMTIPGAVVPTAGTTVVGVYPTHRRRGVLRALMQAQLADFHARGEILAALFASEESIYGRYGYGVTARAGQITLPRDWTAYSKPFAPEGRVRIIEADEALTAMPRIYDALQPRVPGMFVRTPEWWASRVLPDPPERRGGGGPKRFAVLEHDGRVLGYSIYRHHMKWDAGVSTGRLEVMETLAFDGRPTAELWRYLLDIDWVGNVTSFLLPIDHPLFFLLAQPRRLKFRLADGLWARVVDVGALLSARSYAAEGSVVIEVADGICAWNVGRWQVAEGAAKRTTRAAELACDVSALASVALGGFSWSELTRGGQVVEVAPGSASRADAMFRVDRQPWCPEMF